MSEIGKRGFATTVARHFQGDKEGYIRHLHNRANEAVMEGFVDRELARRLENGAEIASMELPVLCDPDDEAPF